MPDFSSAVCAFLTWDPQLDPQPPGWDRHPATNRYRLNGDPDLEYRKDAHCQLHPVGKHLVLVGFEPRDSRLLQRRS